VSAVTTATSHLTAAPEWRNLLSKCLPAASLIAFADIAKVTVMYTKHKRDWIQFALHIRTAEIVWLTYNSVYWCCIYNYMWQLTREHEVHVDTAFFIGVWPQIKNSVYTLETRWKIFQLPSGTQHLITSSDSPKQKFSVRRWWQPEYFVVDSRRRHIDMVNQENDTKNHR